MGFDSICRMLSLQNLIRMNDGFGNRMDVMWRQEQKLTVYKNMEIIFIDEQFRNTQGT